MNTELPSLMSITECMENIQEQRHVTERAYQSAVCVEVMQCKY